MLKILIPLSMEQVTQRLNNMTEEQILERVEKAFKAYELSTSKWAKNYWMSVIRALKRKVPVN